MAFGLTPARGRWEYRLFDTLSTATFGKGDLVVLGGARTVRAYASTDSGYLGIAMSHSTASVPAGKVLVAIPAPNCTAHSDLTTGIATSDLSLGKSVTIYREGNHVSYASTVMGQASRFSALATIAGPISSGDSRVEIAFNILGGTFYSTSSGTWNG